MEVADSELKPLYQWVDEIPLSRPKRNIARDFADGVLVAEVIVLIETLIWRRSKLKLQKNCQRTMFQLPFKNSRN